VTEFDFWFQTFSTNRVENTVPRIGTHVLDDLIGSLVPAARERLEWLQAQEEAAEVRAQGP
jgi:hypothetical protein